MIKVNAWLCRRRRLDVLEVAVFIANQNDPPFGEPSPFRVKVQRILIKRLRGKSALALRTAIACSVFGLMLDGARDLDKGLQVDLDVAARSS